MIRNRDGQPAGVASEGSAAKDRQIVAGIAAAKAKYPVIQGRGVSRVHELSWPVEGLLVAVRGTTPSGSIRPPQQGQRSAAS